MSKKRIRNWRYPIGVGTFMTRSCQHRANEKRPLVACGGCYALAIDALWELSEAGNRRAKKALKDLKDAPLFDDERTRTRRKAAGEWSSRPCQTCSIISGLLGRPFGCERKRK